jgi:2-keto-4-pentenoate hydratase/2-oxohepta-3-ene-1,7-dioic acid hydratase in catechol pathway
MKLATFRAGAGAPEIGAVFDNDGRVLPFARAAAKGGDGFPWPTMLELIEAGPAGLDAARALLDKYGGDESPSVPLAEVTLLSPVPVPSQMRDFLVFPLHVRRAPMGMRKLAVRMLGEKAALAQFGPERTEPGPVPAIHAAQPIYYKGNRFSVSGPDQDVLWPRYSEVMDFELEYGIFIGKGGKNIARENAREHIFGFTIFNDFSARDAQMKEMAGRLGPSKGKDFDTGNAIGPWIVTADDIPDPYALKMEARVNGAVWASGDSSGSLHTFEDMIAHVSKDEKLMAGEFMGSGTMGGGCGMEHDRYLEDGDVVELEVEKIGILRNTVRVQRSRD